MKFTPIRKRFKFFRNGKHTRAWLIQLKRVPEKSNRLLNRAPDIEELTLFARKLLAVNQTFKSRYASRFLGLMFFFTLFAKIMSAQKRFSEEADTSDRVRLTCQIFRFALLRKTAPSVFFRHTLHRDTNRAKKILVQYEAAVIQALLLRGQDREPLNNKIYFTDLCHQNQLDCIPNIQIIGNADSFARIKAVLPSESFVSKPNKGFAGRGVNIWRYNGKNYLSPDKGEKGHKKLAQFLYEFSRDETLICQPLITNSAWAAQYSNGGIVTIKILTAKNSDSDIVSSIRAVLKMPFGKNPINTNGLNSAIDMQSGRVGRGFRYYPLCRGFAQHPDTLQTFEGDDIPDWAEVERLAHRAHQVFSDYTFICWDIALTDQGCQLLEGNLGWDAEVLQFPFEQPLDSSPLAGIAAHELNLRYGR